MPISGGENRTDKKKENRQDRSSTEQPHTFFREFKAQDDKAADTAQQKKAEDYDAKDLIVQEDTARAAKDQASASWWVVWISAFGALTAVVGSALIYVTYVQTRRTAQAAIDAVEVSRDTAKRQLRAYLSLTAKRLDKLNDNECPEALYAVKNSGATPAKDVTVDGSLLILPWPLSEDVTFPERFHPNESTTTIGSGIEREGWILAAAPFTVQEIEKLSEGAHRIYIVVRVSYVDVFNEKQFSNLCASVPTSDLRDRIAFLMKAQLGQVQEGSFLPKMSFEHAGRYNNCS